MQFKPPKDDEKYHWTHHIVRKMMHYGLSADRIKRTIRYPKRCEEGIAPGTIAVMSPFGRSPAGRQPYRGEIWVMYQEHKKGNPLGRPQGAAAAKADLLVPKRKIVITAWRYPGVSPIRHQIPIPANILAELKDEGLI